MLSNKSTTIPHIYKTPLSIICKGLVIIRTKLFLGNAQCHSNTISNATSFNLIKLKSIYNHFAVTFNTLYQCDFIIEIIIDYIV